MNKRSSARQPRVAPALDGGGGVGHRRPAGPDKNKTAVERFTFCHVNPTSVAQYLHLISEIEADAIGLSETKLTAGVQRAVTRVLQDKWDAHWGRPRPVRRRKGSAFSTAWDGVPGGTGVLARKPLPAQTAHFNLTDETAEAWQRFWSIGRATQVLLGPGAGLVPVHLLQYYGYTEAYTYKQPATDKNEAAIRDLLKVAASLGAVPAIVAGDYNADHAASHALHTALEQGGWVDAHLAFAQAQGQKPPPTFVRTGAEPSRLDAVLLNRTAKLALQDVRLDVTSELPGHRPLCLTFGRAATFQKEPKLQPPQPIPVGEEDWTKQQYDECMTILHQESASKWQQAQAGRHTD